MVEHKKWAREMENKAQMDWYDQHHKENMRNWRAWGSWFSWGSPVGLALFYALIIISTGIFIWLVHHK
jgi:hypothetical protein